MSTINILPPLVADQIAAGEVVERPASVIKELVENAIDAGATQIQVQIEEAGKRFICVEDNGCGMSEDDLKLCLLRHATSKINQLDDLNTIASHGFRGEALPSIASVSRILLHTATSTANEGRILQAIAGKNPEIKPAKIRQGTRIEVRDLFLNTPARLSFMRSNRSEEAACVDVMRALAFCHPSVGLRLQINQRKRLEFDIADTVQKRITAILGKEFGENNRYARMECDGVCVSGCFGLPTFNHSNSQHMLFAVNGRVVRDKVLIAAGRAGYEDVMLHNRQPVLAAYIELDPALVDVNVHPAKREVRFSAPQTVRSAVVACIRGIVRLHGQSVSNTAAQQAIQRITKQLPQSHISSASQSGKQRQRPTTTNSPAPSAAMMRTLFSQPECNEVAEAAPKTPPTTQAQQEPQAELSLQLGYALAQIHERYILAQTDDGIILVDQHAAHERITFERMKAQLHAGKIASQQLLQAEEIHLCTQELAWLHEHAAILLNYGVTIRVIDEHIAEVSAIPALFTKENPEEYIPLLVQACMNEADCTPARLLESWVANRACRCALKFGHKLMPEAQNDLLRQMEKTPNIAQCNHGRPSYARLSLKELDQLFGRY
ncbi:MAG: DNA mismatch repair endonuclease MutL [Mariprofundales bacterium]